MKTNNKLIAGVRTTVAVLLLALTACNDEQPLAPQEITLTTPVLTLAETSAGAVVSRAEEATVPMSEVSQIILCPRLTRGMGKEALGANGFYIGSDGEWSDTPLKPLTVSSGPGAYYATAYATVCLVAKAEERPAITNLVYTWQGSMLVNEEGNFVLEGAMTPRSVAIQVKLKDANGNDITDDDELVSYNIHYTGVNAISLSYKRGSDGTYGYEFASVADVKSGDATVSSGDWFSTTYGTADGSWELFTIEHRTSGATYPVYYTGQLTLEAGKLYTFTVQLNGDRQATLVGNVTVSDFATGQEINIER